MAQALEGPDSGTQALVFRKARTRAPVAAIVHYFVHFVSTREIKKNNNRGRTLGAPLLRRRKLCDPLKKEKDRPLESTAFVIYNAAVRLSGGRPPRFRRRPCRPGVRRLSPLGAAGSENRPYPLSVLKSYNERARMASAARARKKSVKLRSVRICNKLKISYTVPHISAEKGEIGFAHRNSRSGRGRIQRSEKPLG